MNKFVAGSVICLATILVPTKTVNAYSGVYYDASIDTLNYQLLVNVEYETGSELSPRREDTYIREDKKHRSIDVSAWKNRFKPDKEGGVYEADDPDVFSKWFKDPTVHVKKDTLGSKKVSVPAMSMRTILTQENYKTSKREFNSLIKGDKREKTLTDAVVGMQRSSGNLSMVDGLNRILNRIETLKGGYEDSADFINTLMALGHLFSGDANNKVIIGVNSGGETAEDDKKNEDKNDDKQSELAKDDEDYEGNGKNIIVTMSGKDVVKTVTITQEGADKDILFEENMLIKAHTGYDVESTRPITNLATAGSLKITFEGVQYENNSVYTDATIDPDDIEYLKLTNLISHALIKYTGGVTSSDAGGEMGFFEKAFYSLISGFVDGIEYGLGLLPIEDLVYNSSNTAGNSRSGYELGMYPKEWEGIITFFYTFVGLISVSVLVFSVLRVFFRMTLDSMNVGKRIELKEDITEILQTVAIMVIFVFMFKLVARVNYVLVGTIYDALGGGSVSFKDASNLGSSLIANLVTRIMLLFVLVYLNVMYVIRALNISLLLALAPAFITAIAFGKKRVFALYVQEMLGNIFLQSFHALFFLFIFEAQSYLAPPVEDALRGSVPFSSVFASVVLVFAVIPTTKMFKLLLMPSILMGVGEEIGNKFSNKVESYGKSAFKAVKKPVVAGAKYGAAYGYNKLEEKTSDLTNLQDMKGSKIYDKINSETKDLKGPEKGKALFDIAEGLDDQERKDLGDYINTINGVDNMEKMLKLKNNVDKVGLFFGKGTVIQKGEALSKMNKKEEKINEGIGNARIKGNEEGFTQVKDILDMKKTPGVYSNPMGEGDIMTQDFVNSVGFDSVNTGFLPETGIKNGSAFEMITSDSRKIDDIVTPPKYERENLPPEVQNVYGAIDVMKRANIEIKNTKDMEKREKIVNKTNKILREKYNIEQEGIVSKDINNNEGGKIKVNLRGDREVTSGPRDGGFIIKDR